MERSQARHSRTLLITLLAAALALWSFARTWDMSRRWAAMDYYQFWVVGRAVAEGKTEGSIYSATERQRLAKLYAPADKTELGEGADRVRKSKLSAAVARRPELETYSTPWLYTVFGATQDGPYRTDMVTFQHLSAVAWIVSLLVLCGLLGYSWPERVLAAALLLESFGPYLEDQNLGNVGRVQFAGLVLLVWLLARRQHLLAGLALGLLVAFKPNIASVALTLGGGWLVSRQYDKLARVVAGSFVGAALAVVLSAWFFGSLQCWIDWAHELGQLLQPGTWDDVNYSLPRALRDVFGLGLLAKIGWLAPLAFFAVLWLRRAALTAIACTPSPRAQLFLGRWDVFLVGVGSSLPLVTSELAWYHYFVGVLPLCLYLLRSQDELTGRAPSHRSRWLSFLALLAISFETARMLFDLPAEAHVSTVALGALLACGLACGAAWSVPRSSEARAGS